MSSHTFTTTLTSEDELRPVRDDVVDAFDNALAALGGEVMHAMDPRRILSFTSGGPPVWSVGMVNVGGPAPYTLLLTYGFSHVLSPEDFREGVAHEYSLAVPAGVPLQPWADAFLRHQCRYILEQGQDIRLEDCIPLRGVPMTRVPFQPEHHAMMPDSTLVGILCAPDPVLGSIDTPHGEVEVRRLVGIDAVELDRVETWSVRGFLEEMSKLNPQLLSPIQRTSLMDYAPFRDQVEERARREGNSMDAAVFDFAWSVDGQGAAIDLPRDRAAIKRLHDGIVGRVAFGRRLGAFSKRSPMIAFEPGEPAGVTPTDRALVLGGTIEAPAIRAILRALESQSPRVLLPLR
jgi:suppressor of fused-like protein